MEAKILKKIRNVNFSYTVNDLLSSFYSPETKIELLEWLKENNALTFTQFPDLISNIDDNIEVVKWLLENNIVPNDFNLMGIVSNDKFKTLNLLASYNVYPTRNAANRANTLAMVKWLYDHRKYTFLPIENRMLFYMKSGQIDILEFWHNNIRPLTQQDVNFLLDYLSMSYLNSYQDSLIVQTLDLFESKGVLPTAHPNYPDDTIRNWLTARNLS